MNLQESLNILIQLADESQKRGILTLDEAIFIKQARDTAIAHLQELNNNTQEKNVEPKEIEEDGNKQ